MTTEDDSLLMAATPGDAALKFPFAGRIYRVRVVDVYDGDTAQVIFRHNDTTFQFGIRILGIDTPEKVGTTGSVKVMALYARDYAREKLLSGDGLHYAVFTGYDKYGGRLLGHLLLKNPTPEWPKMLNTDDNFGNLMITQGLALKYNGATKHSPDHWKAVADLWAVSRQIV